MSVISAHHVRSSAIAGTTGSFPRSAVVAIAACLIFVALWTPAALAAEPGDLDLSFSQNGRVETSFGVGIDGSAKAKAVAIQTNGKIVVAGGMDFFAMDFAVARYNQDGTLDTSFSGDGRVRISHGLGGATAVAIQPDGRIVLAGGAGLIRLTTTGAPDTSFSGDGRLTNDFGSQNALLIQPDGKIVIAGSRHSGSHSDFSLVRFHANGTLDASFDGDGKLVTGFGGNEGARALALQSDGRIVAAGWSFEDDGPAQFALARYHVNGALDSSFDGDGKAETGIAGNEVRANAVAIQANGRIVAAGSTAASGDRDFEVMRYLANGSLDTGFDGNGKQATSFGGLDQADAVAIQADGRILAAGWTSAGIGGYDFALARYTATGALDAAFGRGDGIVTTHWAGGDDLAHGIAIQPADGRIVAAGSVTTAWSAFALARYHARAG